MNKHSKIVLMLLLIFALTLSACRTNPADKTSEISSETESIREDESISETEPVTEKSTETSEEETEPVFGFDRLKDTYAFPELPEEGTELADGEDWKEQAGTAHFVNADGSFTPYCHFNLNSAVNNLEYEESAAFGGCTIRPLITDVKSSSVPRSFPCDQIADEKTFSYIYHYTAGNSWLPLSEEEAKAEADGVYPTASFFFTYEDGNTDCFILSSDFRVFHMQLSEYPIGRISEAEDIENLYIDFWLPSLDQCDAVTAESLPEMIWLHLYALAVCAVDSGVTYDCIQNPIDVPGFHILLIKDGEEKAFADQEDIYRILSCLCDDLLPDFSNLDLYFMSSWKAEADTSMPEETITIRFVNGDGTPIRNDVHISPDGTLFVRPETTEFEAFGTGDGFYISGMIQITAEETYPYEMLQEMFDSQNPG